MPKADNITIAKNTLFLYGRTIVVLFISLYTSRLVLHALGATELGIYNVVAGIVTLMTFLQAAQTQATSRFITFELGKQAGDTSQGRIFSICVTIHILLALCIVLLTESLGLWAVHHWTSIPDARRMTADIVYQFAILALVFQTIRVPLDAVIVAHEKMSVYALLSIVEALLFLGSALLLNRYDGDRLLLYGGLMASVAAALFVIYSLYVRLSLRQYKFRWLWDKETSLNVLSFSGWSLLGSGADTTSQQGVALLMNNYVGLIANAALGFAQQVNNAVKRFVTSFSTAFNPQVIKLYAAGESEAMHILVRRASKFSFVLCYYLALPLMANMPFVLQLWLGEVPQYTASFCSLILVCSLFDSVTGVFYTAITATGKIKWFQIGISLSFLLDLVCAFLLLQCRIHPALVFGSRILTRGVINMTIELCLMKRLLDFDIPTYFKEVIWPIVLTLALTIPLVVLLSSCFSGWARLLITTVASVLAISGCAYLWVLNESERKTVSKAIKDRLAR